MCRYLFTDLNFCAKGYHKLKLFQDFSNTVHDLYYSTTILGSNHFSALYNYAWIKQHERGQYKFYMKCVQPGIKLLKIIHAGSLNHLWLPVNHVSVMF